MTDKRVLSWGVVFVLLFACSLPAYGVVTLEKDANATSEAIFEGTMVLTYPDGRINLLEAGSKVPEIPSGTIIEVFNGKFTVKTEDKDQVVASCLGMDFSVSGGASATLSCSDQAGLFQVKAGTITFKDNQGKDVTLKAGEEYKITSGVVEVTAKPTAQADETGFPVESDVTPPDSRSIEASPSR